MIGRASCLAEPGRQRPPARIAVLATGQRHCYDASGHVVPCEDSRQDAAVGAGIVWPRPRFELRDGRVLDRLTGLEWSREANPSGWPMPLAEAHELVAGLNHDRYLDRDDWRLPGRAELRSLSSFATRDPALPDGHPFSGVFLSWYWSATPSARNPDYSWYLHMEGARTFFGHRREDHLVWPVRGSSPVIPVHGQVDVDAAARFEHRDGVVLDHGAGLAWSRDADLADGEATWSEALELVRGLDHDPRMPGRGWRLPTINELDSLVDLARAEPALPDGHPFVRVREAYWSSTTSAYESDWAMASYFDLGRVGVGQKGGRWFSVWAVRDLPDETAGGGAASTSPTTR